MNDERIAMPSPERAEFLAWLQAYAGGGDNWRGNVLMGEHDIALALWLDKRREIERLRAAMADAMSGQWAAA